MNQHILQKATGKIAIGNAGLVPSDIRAGYVAMLCTVDINGRFVDIAVTREQISDLINILSNEITLLDAKKS